MKTLEIKSILSAVAICAALCGCGKKDDPAVALESLQIQPQSVSLMKGETVQLEAVLVPENVTERPELTWKSSKPAVATVSADGLVTAVAKGEAYIVLSTADGMLKANCLVKVTTPTYTVSITYAGTSTAVPDVVYGYPGMELSVTASHDDNEQHTFSWNSSDTSAAEVSDGVVSFKLAQSSDGEWQYYGKSAISVTTETGNSAGFEVISSLGFTLGGAYFVAGDQLQINFGQEYDLCAYYEDGAGKTDLPYGVISLSTSNPKYADISWDGSKYVLTTTRSEDPVDVLMTIGGQSYTLFTINKALPSSGDLDGYDEKNG